MKQYFLYLRENNHPVACLAIKADGPDSAYQVSTWSKKDRFDKTVARNVAEGRLVKNPIPVDLADSNLPLWRTANFRTVLVPLLRSF
jgi:hypothetical protein